VLGNEAPNMELLVGEIAALVVGVLGASLPFGS
jgi:hypothetical protein